MKHLRLLVALLALLTGVGNLCAQTDVTSTYLTNADFSQGPVITADIRGYGKDMAAGDVYGFQDVTGWTKVVTKADNSNATYPNSAMGAGVLAYGSTNQLKGNNVSAPATGPENDSANGLGFFAVWGCGGYYYQDVTLPAGKYKLTFPIYCISGTQANTTYTGFFPTSGTNRTVAINTTVGSWVNQTVEFTLTAETAGQIRLGYQSTGDGSSANPHLFFDGVKIEFTATVVKDALEKALTAAKKANESLNSNELTSAIATAQSIYDDENATQEEVNAAAATLNAAVELAMSAAGDVSFLIPNLGFESCTETTTNAAAGGSAVPLAIDGNWTQTASAAWSSSAVVAYGGAGQVNGVSAPSADNAGNTGKTLGVSVGWGGAVIYKSAAATLPAGVYTLKVYGYNNLSGVTQFKSLFGFVPTTGNPTLSTKTAFTYGTWVEDVVTFTLNEATEGSIQVGGQGISGGSGSNAKVFFDNVTIGYKSFLAGAKEAWDEAVAAAEQAKTDCSSVTGEELTALNTELAKAEPTTKEGYEQATQDLTSATESFIAAKPNYDALVAEIAKAKALGMDERTVNGYAATEETTSAIALTNTQNLKVAEYTYVSTNYAYGVELGTWTTEGPTGSLSDQHYKGSGNSYLEQSSAAWGQSSWTIKYSQNLALPAGKYVFKVAGRQAASDGVTLSLEVKNGETVLGTVSDFPKGDTGLGINTSGATDFTTGEGHEYVNGGAGRGWEWRYVQFELSADATVNVAVNAVATIEHMWVSFCDATVQTDKEANISLIAYNIALNDAQTALANSEYTNVTGEEKTTLKAAIDADETLDKTSKEAIEEATATLTQATATFTAAKAAYDAFVDAKNAETPELKYAAASKKDDLTKAKAATDATSASDAETKTAAITKALRVYYESHALAEGVEGAINCTEKVKNNLFNDNDNDWTSSQDGGTKQVINSESFTDGDGNNNYNYYDYYNNSANNQNVSQTIEGLEPGIYILTVTARAATSLTDVRLYAGSAQIEIPRQGNSGQTFDRGWNDVTLRFVKTNSDPITIKVASNPSGGNHGGWFGFTRVRLVKLPTPTVELHDTDADIPAACDFANVTLTRKFVKKWNPICLPFEVTDFSVFGDNCEVVKYTGDEMTDENHLNLKFETVTGKMDANVPYMVWIDENADVTNSWNLTFTGVNYNPYKTPVSTGTNYNYVGVYKNYAKGTSPIATGDIILSSGAYKTITGNGGNAIKGFRGYWKKGENASEAKSISAVIDGQETNDIKYIELIETMTEGIYNLQGQKVNRAQKGVYIVNGKKVVVK